MNRHARQLFYFGWGNFAPIFNPLAQAVQILAKYGGSLWVASPAYTFTNSDGTGAAGDNSDAGYVRDLCGNARPLTQATTGFKPKLRLISGRWAWVFDGVDDGLATVAQPTASSETFITVSQRGASSAFSKYIAGRVSSADTSTGAAIYQGASDMRPYGLCIGNIYGPYSDLPVHVMSAVAAQGSFKVRQSGVQVGAGTPSPYTSNANPVSIGKAVNASRYFNAGVFAAAYAPAAIPDAELLIIERAMAQLGGITI